MNYELMFVTKNIHLYTFKFKQIQNKYLNHDLKHI